MAKRPTKDAYDLLFAQATDPARPLGERTRLLLELLPYCRPKLRQIDSTGVPVTNTLVIRIGG